MTGLARPDEVAAGVVRRRKSMVKGGMAVGRGRGPPCVRANKKRRRKRLWKI